MTHPVLQTHRQSSLANRAPILKERTLFAYTLYPKEKAHHFAFSRFK